MRIAMVLGGNKMVGNVVDDVVRMKRTIAAPRLLRQEIDFAREDNGIRT